MKPPINTNNGAGSDCPAASCSPSFLCVAAAVRYWEDATVNGVEDVSGDLIPCRFEDLWLPQIELATGTIQHWPKGTTASIHYKVCDAGKYYLADTSGKRIAKWKDHYVPDRFLTVGDESGYGDYIILDVDGDGRIAGWETPEIDPDEWESISLENR
jgi:uncharacterized protein YuzE